MKKLAMVLITVFALTITSCVPQTPEIKSEVVTTIAQIREFDIDSGEGSLELPDNTYHYFILDPCELNYVREAIKSHYEEAPSAFDYDGLNRGLVVVSFEMGDEESGEIDLLSVQTFSLDQDPRDIQNNPFGDYNEIWIEFGPSYCEYLSEIRKKRSNTIVEFEGEGGVTFEDGTRGFFELSECEAKILEDSLAESPDGVKATYLELTTINLYGFLYIPGFEGCEDT